MGHRQNIPYHHYYHIGFLLALLMLAGCQPRKHLISSDDPHAWLHVSRAAQWEYIDSLEEAVWDFKTLQARAKGYLTIDNKANHEVNIQIRMKKDEVIWISATALMGLEAGRVLITPDSIQVINRLESVYIQEPFQAASEWLGSQVDFQGLQKILSGQAPEPAQLRQWRLSRDSLGAGHFSGDPAGKEEIIFDFLYRLSRWKGERLEVLHAYPTDSPPARFPVKSTWSVLGERFELLATLEYSHIVEDQPLNFPFSIPNGYRRMH